MSPSLINVLILPEEPKDYAEVYAVNTAAFDTPAEAKLVEVLRVEAHPYVSLVANEVGEIVGHVLFTPVELSGHAHLKIMGLGPVAVAPSHQSKGIGSALIKAGLERCKELGYGAVVVLGHKGYYPRFRFTPSVRHGITCEYDVPPETFMVVELVLGYLQGAQGIIKYHAAFHEI